MTKDELYGELDAALESAKICEDEYQQIRKAMAVNAVSARQARGLLFWLDLNEKWSDAELAAPDMILQELREQLELDRAIRNGFAVDNEILQGLWEAAQLAHKIHDKFEAEYERPMTREEHSTMVTLFIEQNKRDRPQPQRNGGGGNRGNGGYQAQKCDACGGDMWDNRKKKRDDPDQWGGAPDFTCKDKSCSSRRKKQNSNSDWS